MDFFQTFWTWLNSELASYIGENTARVASILEPAIITLGTVYVMIWGYLQLTGSIEEPFVAGLKRIMTLAVILGAALHLWLYNTLLVDTFYNAPTEFAGAIVGAADPVHTIDAIWNAGGAVADQLFRDGVGSGFWNGIGGKLAGIAIWLLMGLLCVYTMFLLALSSVSESVLLALGPLFIVTLLFDSTRRFFEAWLAQLANYAMITILTVMVAALLLHLVASYAQQTAALGTGMKIVDALNMLLVTGLVILFMRQVMPVAGGLAGGVTLGSFGAMGRPAGWAASRAAKGMLWSGGYGWRKFAPVGAKALGLLGIGAARSSAPAPPSAAARSASLADDFDTSG